MFATVCLNELGADPALAEGFLGHKRPASTAVAKQHCLKRVGAEGLRPLVDLIDGAFGLAADSCVEEERDVLRPRGDGAGEAWGG